MKRFLVVMVMFGLLVLARAEDQTWALTDGRTVTVVKVLSQNPTHVTVRCAEGILQIDKRQLPEALRSKYPYDEAAAAAKLAKEEAERARLATAPVTPPPKRPSTEVRTPPPAEGGVSIVGVRATARATASVTIANRSANEVDVRRELLVGVNVNGTAYPALRFLNAKGDIFTHFKIPANATKEFEVVFNIPEGDVPDITAVYWAQQ